MRRVLNCQFYTVKCHTMIFLHPQNDHSFVYTIYGNPIPCPNFSTRDLGLSFSRNLCHRMKRNRGNLLYNVF